MLLKSIRLKNFRNYLEENILFKDDLNIFIGDNAQGKTNIIEAIHMLALGISHRTRKDRELINIEKDIAALDGEVTKEGASHNLKLTLNKGKSKVTEINKFPAKIKELCTILNMILFSPEDLYLIKGSPKDRRRFIDVLLCQSSPLYYEDLNKYNRLILQRNTILKKIQKQMVDKDALLVWDDQLVNIGTNILLKRLSCIGELNKYLANIHKNISKDKEELRLIYESSILDGVAKDLTKEEVAQIYREKMESSFEKDVLLGTTTKGIHRDDLDFKLNKIKLKAYGSQGQQRSSVLSLKLSQIEYLKEENGDYPLLLLDDVMSELDHHRRSTILAFIKEKKIQTFITTTDISLFPKDYNKGYFYVKRGKVEIKDEKL